MPQPIISVENLGKSYLVGHQSSSQERYNALRDVVGRSIKNFGRKALDMARGRQIIQGDEVEEFWALKDVSFEVNEGEVVGIIGRNGAGKSTLLKVLSRITEPTRGKVTLGGRVASLLEVGTGFHPELSGRENIFLNGAILGMTRSEIKNRFDEIVDFAGVEKFLDTPVKRYSSGMYVRLAFAVAAHLEPEILVVDEVLAVGDAEFQNKCLGKMKDVASGGRTVLFVSHNMAAISRLTDQCLFFEKGRVKAYESTSNAIQLYLEAGSNQQQAYTAETPLSVPHIRSLEVHTSDAGGVHETGNPLRLSFEIDNPQGTAGLCLSFQILNQFQHPVAHAWRYDPEAEFCRVAGTNCWECLLPNSALNVGRYSLRVFLSEPPGGEVFQTLEDICKFDVVTKGQPPLFGYRPEACACLLPFQWNSIG